MKSGFFFFLQNYKKVIQCKIQIMMANKKEETNININKNRETKTKTNMKKEQI